MFVSCNIGLVFCVATIVVVVVVAIVNIAVEVVVVAELELGWGVTEKAPPDYVTCGREKKVCLRK